MKSISLPETEDEKQSIEQLARFYFSSMITEIEENAFHFPRFDM